jgi:hypothetical protein
MRPTPCGLQIELGADYGVTLTIREDAPPKVTLWRGKYSETFGSQTRASFRAWLDQMAFGQE